MKIKRYFAADMRQAIRLVREEQGPDAVILSNRKVDGGVEVVAAVDYDEALVHRMAAQQAPPPTVAPTPTPPPPAASAPLPPPAVPPQQEKTLATPPQQEKAPTAPSPQAQRIVWSQDPALVSMREEIKMLRGMLESQLTGLAWRAQAMQHPWRARLLERLLQVGLAPSLCRHLAGLVEYGDDAEHHWRQALAQLARRLTVTDDDIISHGGVVALVGATGVGKTTTVAKLAARHLLRHGPDGVALVTTDSFRIGAHQQLRTYGRLLGVPVYAANDAQELRNTLAGLEDKSLVLIDTAGMSQRDVRLAQQFAVLQEGVPRLRTYLVLSAVAQRFALDETVRTFEASPLAGCILTKLDESASLGDALSVVVERGLRLAYVGTGQRVPEDLQPARANPLVRRMVELMLQQSEVPDEEALANAFGRMAG